MRLRCGTSGRRHRLRGPRRGPGHGVAPLGVGARVRQAGPARAAPGRALRRRPGLHELTSTAPSRSRADAPQPSVCTAQQHEDQRHGSAASLTFKNSRLPAVLRLAGAAAGQRAESSRSAVAISFSMRHALCQPGVPIWVSSSAAACSDVCRRGATVNTATSALERGRSRVLPCVIARNSLAATVHRPRLGLRSPHQPGAVAGLLWRCGISCHRRTQSLTTEIPWSTLAGHWSVIFAPSPRPRPVSLSVVSKVSVCNECLLCRQHMTVSFHKMVSPCAESIAGRATVHHVRTAHQTTLVVHPDHDQESVSRNAVTAAKLMPTCPTQRDAHCIA